MKRQNPGQLVVKFKLLVNVFRHPCMLCARLRDVLSVMTYQVHYVNLTLFLLLSQSNVKITFLIF